MSRQPATRSDFLNALNAPCVVHFGEGEIEGQLLFFVVRLQLHRQGDGSFLNAGSSRLEIAKAAQLQAGEKADEVLPVHVLTIGSGSEQVGGVDTAAGDLCKKLLDQRVDAPCADDDSYGVDRPVGDQAAPAASKVLVPTSSSREVSMTVGGSGLENGGRPRISSAHLHRFNANPDHLRL